MVNVTEEGMEGMAATVMVSTGSQAEGGEGLYNVSPSFCLPL